MYPSRRKAMELLHEAHVLEEGPWAQHSLNVAQVAEIIAKASGLDPEKAYVGGLLHDIGRRFGASTLTHALLGYHYLSNMGYYDAARICLTHSFPTQKISDYGANLEIGEAVAGQLSLALAALDYDDYDRLIQLADCLADAEGLVDMDARMDDVARRYGGYPAGKREKNKELKAYFTQKAGRDLDVLLAEQFQQDK